jgi:hypothetical protein
MFASLTVISFIFAFAWLQQQFLNRLIAADLETLEALRHTPSRRSPDSESV